jgi:hypothetical protein
MKPLATDEAALPDPPREPLPAAAPPVTTNEFRPDEAAAALARLEGLLREIRGALDAGAREQQHRQFSIARLLGAMTQVSAVGLVLWAALDWAFQGESAAVIVKLSFATVLQLMAVTAFYLSREAR